MAALARERFLDHHRSVAGALAGARLAWLERRRTQALERFAELGLPTRKIEAWKYTSLAPLDALDFRPAPARVDGVVAGARPYLVDGGEELHRLVFVDGRLRADVSELGRVPHGVRIAGLAETLAEEPRAVEETLGEAGAIDGLPLLALNTAFMDDGFVLVLPRDAVLEAPVEIVFLGRAAGGPVAFHPRNLIVAGAGSRATVIEYHVGDDGGAYFANTATEILAGEGSIVRHCRVQDESPAAIHVATTLARLARGAQLDSFAFARGGRLSRNEIRVSLDAPGAECRLNGAYMMKGDQHVDNTTRIEHAAPETASREMYKGVLDDAAHAVFQGAIVVRPDAQKINGHQLSRTILLSDKAEIDTKPELEIYADDVKCSHGAAIGALDEEALFYFRARGIPEAAARRMLVEAFLGEVMDGIALAGLRTPLQDMAAQWMRRE